MNAVKRNDRETIQLHGPSCRDPAYEVKRLRKILKGLLEQQLVGGVSPVPEGDKEGVIVVITRENSVPFILLQFHRSL